jgi:transposase
MAAMLDVTALKAEDLKGLSPEAVTELAAVLLAQLADTQSRLGAQIADRDRAIKFKDAKIERITFELARLKAWKFGARTEAMSAAQRLLFAETLAEDEADLSAQLAALKGEAGQDKPVGARKRPRREKLPDHLRRVEHCHEPEDTTCKCGQPMVRIGEDVSERLDIVPAEFFVHRHIRGKWACKCCQTLVQEPVEPQVIDKGIPTAGLVAHTLVCRFVDHLPYYRLEQINARSGVHTPRSTLAAWSGAGAASLLPLYEAHRDFVLSAAVLHADETAVKMLDPGAGKTARAYVWAYARGEHDPLPGVVYQFCSGRGSKFPANFLSRWCGTLSCDDYPGYDLTLRRQGCIEAGCLAHARRKFDELAKANASVVAEIAIVRIAQLYRVDAQARMFSVADRLAHRKQFAQPLWDSLHEWMLAERERVPDGSAIAAALDYSLNRWGPLGQFLKDGAVSIDNNHLERLLRPWAMGRKAWLFAGSELAGQRAAMVMSLLHSAKLHGHDPWVYLSDVLGRLQSHPNHRIEELLPHRWQADSIRVTQA